MLKKAQAFRLTPWAWSLAWLLTGLGFWISVVNSTSSTPPPHFLAYISLGALGWGFAGYVTAGATVGMPGLAVRLAGWLAAAVAFISLSIFWILSWDAGFLAIIVAPGIAGALGGMTGSVRRGAWRVISGILLGVFFLILSGLSFYTSYFSMFLATSISQRGGDIRLVDPLGWILPGAVFGLAAGLATRWILGLSRLNKTTVPGSAAAVRDDGENHI